MQQRPDRGSDDGEVAEIGAAPERALGPLEVEREEAAAGPPDGLAVPVSASRGTARMSSIRWSAPRPVCSWVYACIACPSGMTRKNRYKTKATRSPTEIVPAAGFVHGERPTSVDAGIYGFIANIHYFPIPTPLKAFVDAHQNLVAHCERVHAMVSGS